MLRSRIFCSILNILTDVDSDICFIGISFYKILDEENKYMRSSIAQTFNKDGKGLIFTGKQFEWKSKITKVSTPHLKYEYAKELISNVLSNYVRRNKHTPKQTLKQICEEILALTKLNFNNCNYYSSLPITLQFLHKGGEILQYLPEGIEPPNRYFYYM